MGLELVGTHELNVGCPVLTMSPLDPRLHYAYVTVDATSGAPEEGPFSNDPKIYHYG